MLRWVHVPPSPSFRNTTGVTEEALKEFSMMFK